MNPAWGWQVFRPRSVLLALALGCASARTAAAGTLEEQLAAARARLARMADDLAKTRAEIAKLKQQLADARRERAQLAEDTAASEQNLATVRKELERVREELELSKRLLSKFRGVRPHIGPGLVPHYVDQPQKPIRGKATAVDEQLGLVIINRGQGRGVRKGHAFYVYRKDKYIGKVIIDEVFPDVSAARYSAQDMQDDVAVGDDVTTKPKEGTPRPRPAGREQKPGERGHKPREPEKVIRGKIKAKNRDPGLVVLDVGQRHGVKKGQRFNVFRGEVYVGSVIVDQVFPDVPVARPTSKYAWRPQVGDDVTTKLLIEP